MTDLFEILQYEYSIRALIASSIVGMTCGILGCFVTLRRMALIGDALSHAVLPGVVIGFIFWGHDPLAIFIGAVVAGLFTAILITWIQRNSITKEDSSIGIVFTGMFALGIIGISWLTKKEGIHLDMKGFLFGNVLGVSNGDLWLTALIGIYVLICITLFFKYFFITTFDPVIAATMGVSVAVIHYFLMFLLSLSVVASLQSVGVILVVAMLIVPSSTAYLLTDKLKVMIIISAFLGLLSATSGLLIAILLEITPGPTMTVMAVLFFGAALLFSPKKGFLINSYRKLKKQFIIDHQDILKTIYYKIKAGGSVNRIAIVDYLNISLSKIKIHLLYLRRLRLINTTKDKIVLTEKGNHQAIKLVRAHRLWETYLATKMGLPAEELHEPAEKIEHLLPEEILEKVDQVLGHPQKDPHGQPIPKGDEGKEREK
ncbi:MAG: iron chelate uptake ABC transporter family permease subunit [Cytophagales bacterium]|nr:iron chelate uptake ABC transporter family permease subunit [Cytophagales bacterium]